VKQATLVAAVQRPIRAAVATSMAVSAAAFLRLEFPLYALITAVIVTDPSPTRTRQLAIPRLAGTVLGAAFGAALSYVLPAGPLAIGVAVFAAACVSQVAGLQEATKVAGYVSGIVVLSHSADRWSYAVFRSAETLLGIGAAVLVSFVPLLLRTKEESVGSAS
jgi:uncharacterized membrane protein YgaE (UPF0421/DUF939 family)